MLIIEFSFNKSSILVCCTSEIIFFFHWKKKITEQVHNDAEQGTNARIKKIILTGAKITTSENKQQESFRSIYNLQYSVKINVAPFNFAVFFKPCQLSLGIVTCIQFYFRN